jgi:DNA-binding XRE family transcriptional regulator
VDNALFKELFMWNLKQKVKRLRKKRKWTQEDLAHEIGVSLSTVQRWERQGGKPIRIIARKLNRLFAEVSIK